MYRWVRSTQGFAALALLLLISGCGTSSNTPTNTSGIITANNTSAGSQGSLPSASEQVDAVGNPPFQNKLNIEVAPLDSNYDPIKAKTADFTNIQVVNAQGKPITLDAKKQPILLVAYWCPHCQRTLVLLSKNINRLSHIPIIISMGFRLGTTLAEAKDLTDDEESFLHLSSQFKIYYGLNVNANELIPIGYPTLVYNDGRTLAMLYAEHTFAIWKKALAAAK